jgi:hypothetical protein
MPVTARGGAAVSPLSPTIGRGRPPAAGPPLPGGAGAGLGGFLDDAVPGAAGGALARPFGRDRAAGLADVAGGGFGHGVGLGVEGWGADTFHR